MSRALVTAERREPQTKEQLSRGLNERQRRFAEARGKGFSLARSAEIAGYDCSSKASFRAVGWQLSQDLQVSRLVAWYARNQLAAATGVAARVLTDVASDDTVKPEHRVKAANSILARGGVPVAQSVEVEHSGTVEHRASPTMAELRARAGLPPLPERPALPPAADVIDAEFTEVEW